MSNKWPEIKKFRPKDFACSCGTCHWTIDLDIVKLLDRISQEMRFPVAVLRGVICPRASSNGLSRSLLEHVPYTFTQKGHAIDIVCPTPEFRYEFIRLAINVGVKHIEVGATHIHIDNLPYREANELVVL